MICQKCGNEMEIGYAIEPMYEYSARIMPLGRLIQADELKLIDCWKCPSCGHSDDRIYVNYSEMEK